MIVRKLVSKVTVFQISLILSFFIFLSRFKINLLIFLLFSSYVFFGFLLKFKFPSLESLNTFNNSIADRFAGAYDFLNHPTFFGYGTGNSCQSSINSETTIKLTSCYYQGINSFFGSFLQENGIFGIILIILLFTFLCDKIKQNKVLTVALFCSGFSVHYLTFFPIMYVLIAIIFCNYNSRLNENKHNSYYKPALLTNNPKHEINL